LNKFITNEFYLSLNKLCYGLLKLIKTLLQEMESQQKKTKTSKAIYFIQHIHTTKIKGACTKDFKRKSKEQKNMH